MIPRSFIMLQTLTFLFLSPYFVLVLITESWYKLFILFSNFFVNYLCRRIFFILYFLFRSWFIIFLLLLSLSLPGFKIFLRFKIGFILLLLRIIYWSRILRLSEIRYYFLLGLSEVHVSSTEFLLVLPQIESSCLSE